jgi:hypothetical protein
VHFEKRVKIIRRGNMKYSKLKHDLEIMELQHKHEIQLLNMKHEQARKELLIKCTHKYEDGSSAQGFRGSQWDNYNACDICGRRM